MKKSIFAIGLMLGLGLISASAQFGGRPGGMGGGPQGPQIAGAMAKLFGDNKAFSATVEFQIQAEGQDMTMPGKIAFDDGKSRFDMDMSDVKGAQIPPDAAAHMKQMGMDKMSTISLPDQKALYIMYPEMQAYAQMSMRDSDSARTNADFKIDTTELGKETVDGHPCIKNKAVVTDDKGNKHEYTVWNATDLNKFPVKLDTSEQGHAMTLLFKDVKLSKPDASQFNPPSDYKKYDSIMALMQQEVMKRMGGMGGPPR